MASPHDFPPGLASVGIGAEDFTGLVHYREAGIRFLEVEPLNRGWIPGDAASTRSFLELCKANGVTPHSVHGYFFPHLGHGMTSPDAAARGEAIRLNRALFHAARDIGARYVVEHLQAACEDQSPEDEMAMALEALRQLVPEAERTGVRIAVENLGPRWGVRQVQQLIGLAGSDHVGICFDTGHAALYGNLFEDLRLCGDRLMGLHVHDCGGGADHVLPYRGFIDWKRFGAALRETGYRGVLMIEARRSSESETTRDFVLAARQAYDRLVGEL